MSRRRFSFLPGAGSVVVVFVASMFATSCLFRAILGPSVEEPWAAIVFLGTPVAITCWVVARANARHRRAFRPRHLCPACGYDLRATPDARGLLLPRCPECGRETDDPTP